MTAQCWWRTQSVTGFVLPGADVESCEEDGVVVVSALSASQSRLPVAEAVQCVVCMVVDHQAVLWDKADKERQEAVSTEWMTLPLAFLCLDDQ